MIPTAAPRMMPTRMASRPSVLPRFRVVGDRCERRGDGEAEEVRITDDTGVDSDPDGDALSASVVEEPLHGSLSLNADGSFTYDPYDAPIADFADSDSFTYQSVSPTRSTILSL